MSFFLVRNPCSRGRRACAVASGTEQGVDEGEGDEDEQSTNGTVHENLLSFSNVLFISSRGDVKHTRVNDHDHHHESEEAEGEVQDGLNDALEVGLSSSEVRNGIDVVGVVDHRSGEGGLCKNAGYNKCSSHQSCEDKSFTKEGVFGGSGHGVVLNSSSLYLKTGAT